MHPRSSFAATSLAAAALVSGPLAAQDTVVEAVEVQLVDVDVWVTDKGGNPVSGLEVADFRVLHDGEPVAITHFAEIEKGRPVAAQAQSTDTAAIGIGAAPPAPSAPPHVVVVLDERHLSPGSIKRMVRDLDGLLAAATIPAEQVMILRLERGLSIEIPFGTAGDDLASALRRLEQSVGASVGAAEIKQVMQALQSVWDDLQSLTATRSLRSISDEVAGPTASQGANALSDSSGGAGPVATIGGTSGRACDDYVDRVEPIVVQWARRELTTATESLRRLGDVTSFLSGVPGPKILLYVSDGPGTAPGFAATSFVRGLCPAFQTDLEVDSLPAQIDDDFLLLARRANANRVVFYPVQGAAFDGSLSTSGSQASRDSRGIRGFERSRTADVRKALTLLAEETGGRAILGRAQVGAELQRVADEIGTFYSLAFPPPAGTGPGSHSLEVRLADEALSARHRRSYTVKETGQWLTERLESALYLGLVDNPLGVRLGAGAVAAGTEREYSLPLHVVVPADRLSFVERHGLPLSRLTLRVMALHTEDRTLSISSRSMFLPRPEAGTGNLDLNVPIELEGGRHALAVAVLDTTSGTASFVSTTVEVGSADGGS